MEYGTLLEVRGSAGVMRVSVSPRNTIAGWIPKMMKRRIYADTSVIGGYFDEEFELESRRLFRRFEAGQDILTLSDRTELELLEAPERVQALIDRVPQEHLVRVTLSEEARNLAEEYVNAKAIGGANRMDAQHIAIATVSRVDVLASWNFRHIVNLERIHAYNSVNLRLGYPVLEIRSPREIITYEGEEEGIRRSKDDARDQEKS